MAKYRLPGELEIQERIIIDSKIAMYVHLLWFYTLT